MKTALAHDSVLWRRMAAWGSQRGPTWLVRWSPPLIGVAIAACLPRERAAVRANLRRVRGEAPAWRDTVDVASTFASYAGAFAESLTSGSRNAGLPRAVVHGARHFHRAIAAGRGIVLVTAHTGGWETVGTLLGRDFGVRFMMVMAPERDSEARELHDRARRAAGFEVTHADGDPFSGLGLVQHLRGGGVVGVQIDRVPRGTRGRAVRLFGREGAIPEGPLRLAQLTGAPLLPVFCARTGFRCYRVDVHPAIHVARRALPAEVDGAAGTIAAAFEQFVREHPTQWHDFGRG